MYSSADFFSTSNIPVGVGDFSPPKIQILIFHTSYNQMNQNLDESNNVHSKQSCPLFDIFPAYESSGSVLKDNFSPDLQILFLQYT